MISELYNSTSPEAMHDMAFCILEAFRHPSWPPNSLTSSTVMIVVYFTLYTVILRKAFGSISFFSSKHSHTTPLHTFITKLPCSVLLEVKFPCRIMISCYNPQETVILYVNAIKLAYNFEKVNSMLCRYSIKISHVLKS